MTIEERVRAILSAYDIPKEKEILVGVSGGADSVALAQLLYEAGYRTYWVHINFQLRGEESDADADFVIDLRKERFPDAGIIVFKEDTQAIAEAYKISVEMAARILRYQIYDQVREEEGIRYVVVGHHADDQVETMLLNLARGTGGKGLCGMDILNEQNVLRPLLTTTRAEIEAYLKKRQLPYRTDSTNSDTTIKRNLIRHELIPLFEKLNPSFRTTMLKSAAYFREEQEVLDEAMYQAVGELVSPHKPNHFDLDTPEDIPHLDFHLSRVLRSWHFSEDQVEKLLQSRSQAREKVFTNKEGNISIHLYRGKAFIIEKESEEWQELQKPYRTPIKRLAGSYNLAYSIGTITLGGFYGAMRVRRSLVEQGKKLIVRPATKEDTFQPFGMKRGGKKLFRYLGEKGIPSIYREVWPVLELDGTVIAVLGMEIAEVARCPEGETPFLIDFIPTAELLEDLFQFFSPKG